MSSGWRMRLIYGNTNRNQKGEGRLESSGLDRLGSPLRFDAGSDLFSRVGAPLGFDVDISHRHFRRIQMVDMVACSQHGNFHNLRTVSDLSIPLARHGCTSVSFLEYVE